MSLRTRILHIFTACVLPLLAHAGEVILNELNSMSGISASGGAAARLSEHDARYGRYGLSIDYRFQLNQRGHVVGSPAIAFSHTVSAGTLSLWIRGDGTRNSLKLELARSYRDQRGRKLYVTSRGSSGNWATWLTRSLPLTSGNWKELILRVPALSAADRKRNTQVEARLLILPYLDKKKQIVSVQGNIAIDSLRIAEAANAGENGFVAMGLCGSSPYRVDEQLQLFANLMNFTNAPAVVKLRTLIIDRNDMQVGGSETSVEVAASSEVERFVPLQFEVGAATPPLSIEIEARSEALQLDTSQELEIALINARPVIDGFEQVSTRWWTKQGYMPGGNGQNHLGYSRPSRRVQIGRATSGAHTSPSCLRVRYDVSAKGSYAVATDQYLPGGPSALGVWVKGDGSPHQLYAAFEERHPISGHTYRWKWGTPPWDKNNSNYGGSNHYMHNVCLGDLSSKEWRYLAGRLPGGGIGNYNQKLRGPLVDYPFEFKGFFLKPAKGAATTGEFLIDDITIDTQVSPVETLTAFVFADDETQNFAKTKALYARFQNSALIGDTAFNCMWTIRDADGETVASERKKVELAPGRGAVESLGLSSLRNKLAQAKGPLAATATIVDAGNPGRRASHTIWLKKPNASVLCHDFECSRSYLPAGKSGPTDGHSPTNAHHGKFAMLLKSVEGGDSPRSDGVRLNPALPGLTTAVSLWIFGDGSGLKIYPYIRDSAENGRHSMWASEQFALAPITVTWKGWRHVTLDLPNLGEHSTDGVNRVAEVTYPVDISLETEGNGQVWIDEIRALTHLDPAECIVAAVVWPDETRLLAPNTTPHVSVQNAAIGAKATLDISLSLTSASGQVVHQQKRKLSVAAVSEQKLPLAKSGLPAGVYVADVEIAREGAEPLRLRELIQVCDMNAALGPDAAAAIRDENQLRLVVNENRESDLLDWDNVEPLPGRFHFHWFQKRLAQAEVRKADVMIRLGYSADWAGSQGYEQLLKGTYQRAFPNSMHVPTNVADWSEYVRAGMRHFQGATERWLVWENPNSGPPLTVPPAKMAAMLAAADRWRQLYCPDTKLYLGGLLQKGGLQYLANMQQAEGGDAYYGVEVKVDMGGLPPERGGLEEFIDDLKMLMGAERAEPDRLMAQGLDWATGQGRADEFQQAAYLVRSHLILRSRDVGLPVLEIANDAHERDGGGLVYRPGSGLPSHPAQMPFFRLKPSFLAARHIRKAMGGWRYVAAVELHDVLPQQARCLLFAASGTHVAALWRTDGPPVSLTLPPSIRSAAAVDGFGFPTDTTKLMVSAMPVLLTFKGTTDDALASALALSKLDLPEGNWTLIEGLNPASPADSARLQYSADGSPKPVIQSHLLPGAGKLTLAGRNGLKKESFVLRTKPKGELFIRKRYLLTGEGQVIAVAVNGKEAGRWNLRHDRSVPTIGGGARKLPGGFRDAYFHIPSSMLAEKGQKIELTYEPRKMAMDNNSFGYRFLSTTDRKLRLTQIGPVYSVIGRGRVQFDRNIAAGPLAVGKNEYQTGLGTHSPALIEYPLGRQFKRFTATVGIDRMTEGRGSVIFEVHGDEKPLFKSPTMSGFSKPAEIDVDVTGVERLTLVVKDADDGSDNDYANWCDAELEY